MYRTASTRGGADRSGPLDSAAGIRGSATRKDSGERRGATGFEKPFRLPRYGRWHRKNERDHLGDWQELRKWRPLNCMEGPRYEENDIVVFAVVVSRRARSGPAGLREWGQYNECAQQDQHPEPSRSHGSDYMLGPADLSSTYDCAVCRSGLLHNLA